MKRNNQPYYSYRAGEEDVVNEIPKNARALPVFIKQHKVGGTTIATILDCVAMRDTNLLKVLSEWGNHGTPDKLCSNKISPRVNTTNGWHGPWGHTTLSEYSKRGIKYFTFCAVGFLEPTPAISTPHRVFTLLRHPVERLMSAMSYFSHLNTQHAFVDPLYKDPKAQSGEAVKHAIISVANVSFPRAGGIHQVMELLLSTSQPTSTSNGLRLRGIEETIEDSDDTLSRANRQLLRRLAEESIYRETLARGMHTVDSLLGRLVAHAEDERVGTSKDEDYSRVVTAAEMGVLDNLPEVTEFLIGLGFRVTTVTSRQESSGTRSTLALPRTVPASKVGKYAAAVHAALERERSKPNPYEKRSNGYVDPRFSKAQAREAATVLRHDFVVGLTERMDEFLVLMSLELGWPEDHLW